MRILATESTEGTESLCFVFDIVAVLFEKKQTTWGSGGSVKLCVLCGYHIMGVHRSRPSNQTIINKEELMISRFETTRSCLLAIALLTVGSSAAITQENVSR